MVTKPSYADLEERLADLERRLRRQEKANQTLQQQADTYRQRCNIARLMADNAPDMLWAKDLDDRYLFANRSICDNLLHSTSTSEPIGKTDLYFAEREKRAGHGHSFGEICLNSDAVVKANGKAGRFLEDGLVRDSYLALDVHKAPFYDDAGEMIGTVGCGRDVTKELAVSRALKRSERRFRDLIEAMAEIAIQGYDEARRVIFWNQASERLYGYTAEEAIGRRLEELIIPEAMQAEVFDSVRRWLQEGRPIPPGELLLRDKFGMAVPVFSSHVMLDTPQGKELFCIDIDLRAMRQAEREKRSLQDQLRQSQKMEAIGTLAGGIAHDFNNILFSISGQAELLLEDLPPGSADHDRAAQIMASANRGGDLVKRILTFSRRSDQRRAAVDLQAVVEEVLELCRAVIPSNVEIVTRFQEGLAPVHADAVQLHQVVLNLITNASHAIAEASGRITIRLAAGTAAEMQAVGQTTTAAGSIYLVVEDSGTGIAPEILDKIFDPYFTTKQEGHGTGLGLATVNRIVKDHGGTIAVTCPPEGGTVFRVCLPVMGHNQALAAARTPRPEPGGSERILLVDDEAQILAVETQVLSRLGYSVTATHSGPEALEIFTALPRAFDLIITDMTMPRMTGDQLAEKVFELRAGMPVIICTGYSERRRLEKAASLGVATVLTKPVTKQTLARAVRKVLDGAAGGQEA